VPEEVDKLLAAPEYSPPLEFRRHQGRCRHPLEVVRDSIRLDPGAGIAALEALPGSLEQPTHRLHVLLRDRPRSISPKVLLSMQSSARVPPSAHYRYRKDLLGAADEACCHYRPNGLAVAIRVFERRGVLRSLPQGHHSAIGTLPH
jgi:hypothetical protein